MLTLHSDAYYEDRLRRMDERYYGHGPCKSLREGTITLEVALPLLPPQETKRDVGLVLNKHAKPAKPSRLHLPCPKRHNGEHMLVSHGDGDGRKRVRCSACKRTGPAPEGFISEFARSRERLKSARLVGRRLSLPCPSVRTGKHDPLSRGDGRVRCRWCGATGIAEAA